MTPYQLQQLENERDESEYIAEHNARFNRTEDSFFVRQGTAIVIDGVTEIVKRKFIDHFHVMVVFESGKLMFSSDVNYGIQMGTMRIDKEKSKGNLLDVF